MEQARAKAVELDERQAGKRDAKCYDIEGMVREIFHARQIAVKYRHVGG